MIDIINLTYLRIKRNRRNSLLVFTVLLLSFACAIVSVSVVGSISNTNAEYKLDTYGEWYLAIPFGEESDAGWLSEKEWVEALGTARSIGSLAAHGKTVGIGTVDETLIDIGRLHLENGTFPASDNEIAMEADSLSAIGYDYTLGQNIDVTVQIPPENDPFGEPLTIEKTYTLCGIIHEYSDLWYLSHNLNAIPLNSAVITDNAANALMSEAQEMLSRESEEAEASEFTLRPPIPQYFISASEENIKQAQSEIDGRLVARVLSGGIGDGQVCVNTTAHGSDSSESDSFYMYMIALLTFISVICLEIIRLPANTHSFSVLRSVGMSKGQLALLQLFEILFLGTPAMLLGIPLGAGLTWLALRLTLYSGSVPIQVYIPYDTLFFILALWLIAIVLSRLIIFAFTLRVPMTGRMNLSTSKSRYTRLIRSGFIVMLLCVISTCTVFTGIQSVYTIDYMKFISEYPSYIMDSGRSVFSDGIGHLLPLGEGDIEAIRKIPGISDAYGYTNLYVGLSFEGMSEDAVSSIHENMLYSSLPYGMTYLLVIDENDWTDVFDLGKEKQAFHNGEVVLISVPDDGEEYTLPEGQAQLNIYGYEFNIELEGVSSDNDKKKLIGSRTVNTLNTILRSVNTSVASIGMPYTVICSERFIQNLLDTLPKGRNWGHYTTGNEFSHFSMLAMTDLNSTDFATDIIVAKTCNEREISLTNCRQENLARIQDCVQELIMLYFSGACIGIIALMILWSNVSLEVENEKRSFLIKRCIGMSRRQVDVSILRKSLLRCAGAFSVGWLVYILWAVFQAMSLQLFTLSEILKNISANLTSLFISYTVVYVIVLLIGFLLPLMLILYAKKDLRKDGDIK